MRWILSSSLILFFSISAVAQDAGKPVSVSLTVTPKSGNGYEAKVPFTYVFRNCYGELHVNIAKKKNEGLKYLYKGKSYWPGFFNKQSFEKAPVGLISLNADVYDKGVKKGNLRMYNVTIGNGAGCFGQVYKVDQKVGVDAKEASKRAGDFTLSNITIEAGGSRDYKLEKLITAQIKEEEDKKKAAVAATQAPSPSPAANSTTGTAKTGAAATGAAAATATTAGQKANATTNAQPSGTAANQKTTAQQTAKPTGPTDAQKKAQVKKDLDNFQKKQAADMKKVDRAAKKASKKVVSAATNFYKGWQGSGTSIGFSIRSDYSPPEEQEPFWLGMTFGRLWDPTNPRNRNGLISGFETEFAFNSEWLGDSLLTCSTDCRDEPWTRYNFGFFVNFVGNIGFLKYFQPYIGIGWVEAEEFNIRDESQDKSMTFVQDIGIGINLGGEALIKFATNSKMDTTTIGFSFMSGRR